MSDSVYAYMNIKTKRAITFEKNGVSYYIPPYSVGIIHHAIFDEQEQELIFHCVFSCRKPKGAIIEVLLSRFDFFEMGYYKAPEELAEWGLRR